MGSQDLEVHSQWGTAELFHEVADEWRQLCERGPCNQPFFRPEWIAASIEAFASKHRLLLITVREGGRLRAVLPLLEEKPWASGVPFTRLRSAADVDHSPRFELIHGGGDVQAVAHAAWRHLKNLPHWDAIELVNVPRGGAAERLLALAERDSFPTCQFEYAQSPYIVLNGRNHVADFSQFGRSSRFRYHLRQGWRRMGEKGALYLHRAERADPDILQRFYRLEQSGWKGKKGTAIACKPETLQFYNSVARYAEKFGYLSVYFLEQGSSTIAAHFALTYGGRYYPLKVAYDENYSEYGPGHLIIGAVLHDCVARGLSEFDCLGQWTEAKAKWTSVARSHTFCCIFRNAAAGRVLHAATHLQHKLDQALRKTRNAVVAVARSQILRRRRGLRSHT